MGEIKIKIEDRVERLFRKLAMRKFGYQKGALSEAAEEAIVEWAASNEEERNEVADPIEEIYGLLKNVKKSSVELQHEAWDFVVKKSKKKKNVN